MPGMLDDALNAMQPGNPGVAQIAPTPGLLNPTQQGQSPQDMQQALQMLQQLSQNPQAMARFGTQMQQAQEQQTPVQQFGNWMQQASDYDPENKRLAQMAGVFRNPTAMADQKGMTEYMNILKSGGYGQGDMSNAAYNRSLNDRG